MQTKIVSIEYVQGKQQGRRDHPWTKGAATYQEACSLADELDYWRGYKDGYEAKALEVERARADLERIRALGVDLLK